MLEENFLNHLGDGILAVNHKQDICFANQCFLKQLHYKDSLEGRTLADISWNGSEHMLDLSEETQKRLILKDANLNQVIVYADTIQGEWKEERVTWLIIKEWSNSNYSKEELIKLMDMVPYALWIEDFEGNYRYVNATTVSETSILAGRKIEIEEMYTLKGNEVWQNSLRVSTWERDNRLLETQGKVSESRTMKINNHLATYYITKVALRNEEGKINAVCCCKSSNTERRNVEAELYIDYISQVKHKVSALLRYNKASYEERIGETFKIPDYLGAQNIGIYEYNREKQQVEVKSCIGEGGELVKSMPPVPMREEDYKRLVEEKPMWTIESYKERIGWYQAIDENIHSKYVVRYPIAYGDELPGLLIATYLGEQDIYLFNDHIMLRIASHLSLLLKSIKQYENVHQEIGRRRKLDEDMIELFNIPTVLYCIYDLETSHRMVNLGWRNLLGWEEDDIHDYDGVRIVIDEDRQEFIGRIERVKSGESIDETISRFLCKNGDIKSVKWWMKSTDNGKTLMIFGVDVTSEVESLQQMNEYKKALEVETLKAEFLANMSHELKTPLNIIYSIMQIDEMDLKDVLKETIGEIHYHKYMSRRKMEKQNIYRLLRLIDNIVDISKLGSGNYYLNLENCNIVEVVEDITMSVALYIKENQLDIIFDTQEEEIITSCDIEKVERIMLNLLSNAVKYSKETGEILVNVSTQQNQVVIEVSDTGIGIPEEKLDIIFERFVQVDQTLTRKREGSGIGLALVKSLVEVMGGSIEVRSQLGEGTTFTVYLPIQQTSESESEKIKNDAMGDKRQIEKCCIEFSDIYNWDFNQ